MANAVTSVVVASASAVAKLFVIGGVGYVSAIRPRPEPILPAYAMNAISRMNFNLLILPLVYSAMASAVTPSALGSLWFILVAGIGVICLSYATATILGKLPFFRVENKTDFDALRIAAAFPNIVALPILIFPALCEFPVVFNGFYEADGDDEATDAQKFRSCVDRSNAMIFIYFFAWNLLYWILGYPTLVAAGKKRQKNNASVHSTTEQHLSPAGAVNNEESDAKIDAYDGHREQQINSIDAPDAPDEDNAAVSVDQAEDGQQTHALKGDVNNRGIRFLLHLFATALMQTLKSPGFIAMVLGFITACIPPLRDALFKQGGALRFIGSSLESLGMASSSVGVMVVAASLVNQAKDPADTINDSQQAPVSGECDVAELGLAQAENNARRRSRDEAPDCRLDATEQPARDLRASMRKRRSSISQLSVKAMTAIRRRKPTLRMHAWFIFSRLIVTPAVVCLLIIAGDCSGVLDTVPNLAKMVIIVNAGLPGAQLIVLTLKSKGLSDSASVVAKVYLPSYLLSVVTIAAWTSLGLIISVPTEDGASFCKRM